MTALKLPITVEGGICGAGWTISDKNGITIAVGLRHDHAKEIALSLNLHDELVAALKPFAACNPTQFGKGVTDDGTWLWKPNSTNQELPGISVAHIKQAKAALAKLDNL